LKKLNFFFKLKKYFLFKKTFRKTNIFYFENFLNKFKIKNINFFFYKKKKIYLEKKLDFIDFLSFESVSSNLETTRKIWKKKVYLLFTLDKKYEFFFSNEDFWTMESMETTLDTFFYNSIFLNKIILYNYKKFKFNLDLNFYLYDYKIYFYNNINLKQINVFIKIINNIYKYNNMTNYILYKNINYINAVNLNLYFNNLDWSSEINLLKFIELDLYIIYIFFYYIKEKYIIYRIKFINLCPKNLFLKIFFFKNMNTIDFLLINVLYENNAKFFIWNLINIESKNNSNALNTNDIVIETEENISNSNLFELEYNDYDNNLIEFESISNNLLELESNIFNIKLYKNNINLYPDIKIFNTYLCVEHNKNIFLKKKIIKNIFFKTLINIKCYQFLFIKKFLYFFINKNIFYLDFIEKKKYKTKPSINLIRKYSKNKFFFFLSIKEKFHKWKQHFWFFSNQIKKFTCVLVYTTTIHNTFINIYDKITGNTLINLNAGNCGFKKRQRSTFKVPAKICALILKKFKKIIKKKKNINTIFWNFFKRNKT